MVIAIIKIMASTTKNRQIEWVAANFDVPSTQTRTPQYLYICFIRSFANSRRVEQGAWSIGVDSISNVHPSIQSDYYNIESRRGQEYPISGCFIDGCSLCFANHCRSCFEPYHSFVEYPRLSRASSTIVHIYACTRAFFPNLHFHRAYTQHSAKGRTLVVFLAYEDNVCGLSDISGWICHTQCGTIHRFALGCV